MMKCIARPRTLYLDADAEIKTESRTFHILKGFILVREFKCVRMLRVQQQLCLIVLTFFIAHTGILITFKILLELVILKAILTIVSESKISVVDIGADPGDIIFDSRHTLLGAPTDLIRRKRNADGTTTQVEKVASSNGSTVFECYQYTWPGINENNTVSDCPRIKKFTPCFTPFVFTGLI